MRGEDRGYLEKEKRPQIFLSNDPTKMGSNDL